MMNDNNNEHTYKRYDKELTKLKTQISKMGEHVTQQISLMLDELQSNSDVSFDKVLDEVIDNDVAINGMEVKVGKTVLKLLAKRAPMGKDLRFIISSSRIVTELERIGDEVVSMAKSLANNNEWNICDDKAISNDLESLLVLAKQLLDRSLIAVKNDDDKIASMIIAEHVKKGGEFHKKANEMTACVKSNYDSNSSVEQGFNAALLINALIRVSDHIGNICEHVIFLVSGKDVRHKEDNI